MSDEPADLNEQREAESLARALEADGAEGAPADALELAAMLRYSRGQDTLSSEALLRAQDAAEALPFVRRPRRAALLTLASVAAAAATLLLVSVSSLERSAAPAVSPRPVSVQARSSLSSLLDAQALVIARPETDLSVLLQATQRRRTEMLHDLDARYGGSP